MHEQLKIFNKNLIITQTLKNTQQLRERQSQQHKKPERTQPTNSQTQLIKIFPNLQSPPIRKSHKKIPRLHPT